MVLQSVEAVDLGAWAPYTLGAVPKPRSLSTLEGLGDRLRFVAFAEKQAARAFAEAPARFLDAPAGLADAWAWVSREEAKHEAWLLERMRELGIAVGSVPVALDLYLSFEQCHTAREFSLYMANAEERGRVAGERFGETLKARDPRTASIFAQIAFEEREHVALVSRFFD